MESLQGKLLIASTTLLDPNFYKAVLLVVQHNEDGALGLILNRPTSTTVAEAWAQVEDLPCPAQDALYMGGPCEGPLMAVHGHEYTGQIQIISDLFFSGEVDHLKWLIEQGVVFCHKWQQISSQKIGMPIITGVFLQPVR